MKIISKYKDYYDYLQGIYGIDEKLVLQRNNIYKKQYISDNNKVISFYIGEYYLEGLYISKDDKILFGADIDEYSVTDINLKYVWMYNYNSKIYTPNFENSYFISDNSYQHRKHYFSVLKKPLKCGEKALTYKLNCPLLINTLNYKEDYYNKFPILSEFNVSSILNPDDVWLYLSEWLGKRITINEADVPIGDDKTKIQTYGFDLKKSFRYRKK